MFLFQDLPIAITSVCFFFKNDDDNLAVKLSVHPYYSDFTVNVYGFVCIVDCKIVIIFMHVACNKNLRFS